MFTDREYQLEELRVPTSQEINPNSQIQTKLKESKNIRYNIPIQTPSNPIQIENVLFYTSQRPEINQKQRKREIEPQGLPPNSFQSRHDNFSIEVSICGLFNLVSKINYFIFKI